MAKLYAVVLCDSVCERRGDDRHDSDRILRHCALLDASCADIVEKKNAHLVAGYELVGAVRALHGDTDTVSIGVCRQHEICAFLDGKLDAVLHCLVDFRIRIRSGREISVRIFLLRNDRDVCDAHIAEDLRDRDKTCAVQRRVDELEAGCLAEARAYLTGFDCFIESFLAVIFDILDDSLIDAGRKGHFFDAC